ncbi:class E sortase [Streptacidiphilus sp. N1-10]|uniref:Class E sortase n=1 Tax=Streptacidiphilus jeojiensis TaxID=3229225 RepID=A0ABV6XGR4_9ACTN
MNTGTRLLWTAVAGTTVALCVALTAAGTGQDADPAPAPVQSVPSSAPTTAAPRQTTPPTPTAGQLIGTVTIPRLQALGYPYRFPLKQGVDHDTVLNSGAVGHYADTQLPGVQGNVGLAAHRNTHGEPFRHLDRLSVGDTVMLDTPSATYRYTLDRELPQTGDDDYAVLDPIPAQAGYTAPGQYLTLTTCTPEFTSLYRLIWWGHLIARTPHPSAGGH